MAKRAFSVTLTLLKKFTGAPDRAGQAVFAELDQQVVAPVAVHAVAVLLVAVFAVLGAHVRVDSAAPGVVPAQAVGGDGAMAQPMSLIRHGLRCKRRCAAPSGCRACCSAPASGSAL
jgi:hypothetical protein